MIKGYKLQTNSVFGLPKDPFHFDIPEFPVIMERARANITNALNLWLDAKSEYGDDNHPGEDALRTARLEVNGMIRLYLGCVEEAYARMRANETIATRLVGQDYRLPLPGKKQ